LIYLWLADVVVAIHAAYAGFVLFGFLAILLGLFFHWAWIRNLKFRTCHLLCTALVAVEAFWGVTCPLTSLENLLLQQGGRAVDQRSFIGRWMNKLLFYEAPEEIFTLLYASLALLTLAFYRNLLQQRPST
jgi:polyferredoxin